MSKGGVLSKGQTALSVTACDLRQSENGPAHHTDEYETDATRLVVRRGQSFLVRVSLSGSRSSTDQFQLRTGGDGSSAADKLLIVLNVIEPKPGDAYAVGLRLSADTGNDFDMEVFTPSDMGIGRWNLVMICSGSTLVVSDDIVVICNPWNPADGVFLEDEAWRKEYVLQDEGCQYSGSSSRIHQMDWYFGQFEKESLDAALKLISMEGLSYSSRGDPVAVGRHMSALVNSNDDNGVLVGNWSSDFSGGKSPSEWVGSYAILKQFVDSGAPVKYGQCWVFAGVLCTVLRTLGIPARCNTNFASAHDTDANLTIDYFVDEHFDLMNSHDSIWNFHVWNDVWMARPDLPEGFGGWQALDATPQERSSGLMRCGPMPVQAIKQGKLDLKYDGPFIYAEVNGTVKYWQRIQKHPEKYNEIKSDSAAVGKNMSTKKIGTTEREDVTSQYKYDENTPEEQLSFQNARKYVKWTLTEKKEEKILVKFECDIPDLVPIGDDVVCTFKFTNTTSSAQRVYFSVVGKVIQYNGSIIGAVHSDKTDTQVAAGATGKFVTTLKGDKYVSQVSEFHNCVKFFALGGVRGSGNDMVQTYAYNNIVQFEKPTLEAEVVEDKGQVGQEVSVGVSFKNPLPTTLTQGKVRIEGVCGTNEVSVPSIKPRGIFRKTIRVTPRRAGHRRFSIGYSSSSLVGLHGGCHVHVGRR